MDTKIICPHCGKEIELSKSNYDSILSQVKDSVINKSIAEKEKELIANQEAKFELFKKQNELENNKVLEEKNSQIIDDKEYIFKYKCGGEFPDDGKLR